MSIWSADLNRRTQAESPRNDNKGGSSAPLLSDGELADDEVVFVGRGEALELVGAGFVEEGLQAALQALTQLAMAQVGTPDYYAVPNFATSKWAIAHCAGPGSNTAELCQKDSDCTGYLPHYMVPDSVSFVPRLPTTSTDKVDYQRLQGLARGEG